MQARLIGVLGCVGVLALAALGAVAASSARSAPAPVVHAHEGVASCSGSSCHGRSVGDGLVVRQDELATWQDGSSPAGGHSRAYRALTSARGKAIGAKLGVARVETAPECLGCHTDFAPAAARGARFQISDGVGCEACHGGAGGWIASHYTLGASHAANLARGMTALDRPAARAGVCLNCHFGSPAQGQFVNHRMMAAGHPRVSFELDLFTALQRHHDADADYLSRKASPGGVRTWAVGQALALERALTLYGGPRGQEGAFPEFYFFDCHACHRSISDDPKAALSVLANPQRPIPLGMPPFNDENLIMLSAAARTAAPALAGRFETDVRDFHLALARDRPSAVRAAAELAATARSLAAAFDARPFGRAETFAILDQVLGPEAARRYTDYAGAAQAVMAADTLLSALVASGQVDRGRAAAVRPELDRAYREVRDPNGFRAQDFQATAQRIAVALRGLR